MAESASSSASSGVQFGTNGGADTASNPLVVAAMIFGGLFFVAIICGAAIYALTHRKK